MISCFRLKEAEKNKCFSFIRNAYKYGESLKVYISITVLIIIIIKHLNYEFYAVYETEKKWSDCFSK